MSIRNNRYLVRLVLSFLVAGALTTLLLMLVVSKSVSRQIRVQASQTAGDMLAQAYNTTYHALTDIYGDYYDLWDSILPVSGDSAERWKSIESTLVSSAYREPMVHSVYFISHLENLVLSSLSRMSDHAAFSDQGALALLEEFEADYGSLKNEVFFIRQAGIPLDGTLQAANFISMIFIERDSGNRLASSMMVNIEQSRLTSLLNIDSAHNRMIIANLSGKVLSDSTEALPSIEFQDTALYQAVLDNPALEGSFTADYNDERSFISYYKAERLGFVFFSITPYNTLMEPVRQVNHTLFFWFGGAILLSIAASALLTRRLYQPLHDLIKAMKSSPAITVSPNQDEVAYLDSAYSNLMIQNQHSALSRLLQGQCGRHTLDVLEFRRPFFLVAAIKSDHADESQAAWLEQLVQITRSTLLIPAAVMPGNGIAMVFNEDSFDESVLSRVAARIGLLQIVVESGLHTSISVGLGSVVHDPLDLGQSYRNALTALQHAQKQGVRQMKPYGEIAVQSPGASMNRPTITASIVDYIQENYWQTNFTMDSLSSHVGLSIGYLRQIFKQEKGMPINEFLISYRMGKACILLSETELPAKEISMKVGYLDHRYFYALFKKRLGLTTDEYRRKTKDDSPEGKAAF